MVEAVNQIQDTPWTVNGRVLRAMKAVLEDGSFAVGEVPPRPRARRPYHVAQAQRELESAETSSEQRQALKRLQYEAKKKDQEAQQDYLRLLEVGGIVRLAEEYWNGSSLVPPPHGLERPRLRDP